MSNPRPYGYAFNIPTNTIDGIANRLYQEQKIREQQKLQQDKALDDEFARNVAGVKSADIPDITKAYNDFKQAHIALQKKGQKATPQDQMEVMIRKANAFSEIAASKEDKERIANYAKEVKGDKKGVYDPNAHTLLAEWLNTPTKKRQLDKDGALKYQYAMPNIDKEIANAAGKGEEVEIKVGVDTQDALKDQVDVYKRMNPPNVFYNNLFTGLAARSDNRNFTRSVLDNITPEELESLRVRYEAKTSDPKFKAVYGEVQPFPASAGNTELGQAVAIKTMQVVDQLPIEKIKSKSIVNQDRAVKGKNAEWDRRSKLSFERSMALIAANKKQNTPAPDTGYISDEVGAENGVDIVFPEKKSWTGAVTPERTVRFIPISQVDPERLNIIIGKNTSKGLFGVKPMTITMPDGTKQVGYEQDQITGDWVGDKGQIISREAAKDRYINTVGNTAFKSKQNTRASENTNFDRSHNTNKKTQPKQAKKDPLGIF